MLKLARTHHYLFAHKLLPMLFFKEPEMFMSGLKNDCNSILSNWWEKIGFTLEGDEKIALNGFRFRITAKKYKYYTAYFVKMPEAKYAPEAIIVAFVIIKILDKNEIKQQYYTIDVTMEPRPTNPISSSGVNGSHASYMGCIPEIKEFSKMLHVITSYPICKMRGVKFNWKHYDRIFADKTPKGKTGSIENTGSGSRKSDSHEE